MANLNHFLQTGKVFFEPVIAAVRAASTFRQLTAHVNRVNHGIDAGGLRAAATMLKLAASFYPAVLDGYNAMLKEFLQWRTSQDEGARKHQSFIDAAQDKAEKARRMATLTICGYIFMPGATGIGIADVFQMSGDGIRYGEFDVLPIGEGGLVHGALSVVNKFDAGLFGYRIRGHAAHTLKVAHRIILEDAVKTHFGPSARWATPEVARAWVQRPTAGLFMVTSCSPGELVLSDVSTEEERTLDMAVHPCASSKDNTGTAVPLVFSVTSELVFERSSRCPRGAVGAERELHGAQRLKPGDEVTVWTTPNAEDAARECLVAARCWNLDCPVVPTVEGLEGLAFDVVDTGTKDLPTPLEVMNATIAHGVIHREPATVALYLFSPTKTGVESTPGQGLGKTEWLRRGAACMGPCLVDTVNDYERLVANDQFSDKGHSALFTIVDDVADPKFLLSGKTKAAVTAKENEARVKHAGNKKSDNFNTFLCTGNEFISQDAVEEANAEQQRRLFLVRAWSTHVGRVDYFAYVYGTYFSVNPLIQKCILEYWRNLPDAGTRSTAELQELAKRAKTHWSGQVPIYVGFLQTLYAAPRMDTIKLKEARATAAQTSKSITLLTGIDTYAAFVDEKDVFLAASQYVQEHFDAYVRNPGRIRENASLIINALKSAAESGEGTAWAKLYKLATPHKASDATRKRMCFSVERDVIKDVVEACGFRVYDTSVPDAAPTWE